MQQVKLTCFYPLKIVGGVTVHYCCVVNHVLDYYGTHFGEEVPRNDFSSLFRVEFWSAARSFVCIDRGHTILDVYIYVSFNKL